MSANNSIQSPKIQTNIYAVDSSSVMGKDIAWSTGEGHFGVIENWAWLDRIFGVTPLRLLEMRLIY